MKLASAALAAVSVLAFCISSEARVVSEPDRNAKAVDDNALYAIEISCGKNPTSVPVPNPSDWLVARTRNFVVVISPHDSPDPGSITDAFAFMRLYSIGHALNATGQRVPVQDDLRRNCARKFLVNGRRKPSVVYAESTIDNFSQSILGTALSPLLGLITPFFSLFTSTGVASPLITAQAANVGNIKNGILSTLDALAIPQSPKQSLGVMRVGTYVVATPYLRMTISVRSVTSMISDPKNAPYIEDLKKQIDGAITKLDSSKLKENCQGAEYALNQLGITEPLDVSFGLIHLAAHAGFGKQERVECLGGNATVASNAGNNFWKLFPDRLRLTQKEVSWETMFRVMDKLTRNLGAYVQNDPPDEGARAALADLMTPELLVEDRRTLIQDRFYKQPTKVRAFDAIAAFKAKGFYRYGCFIQADAQTNPEIDGAPVIFLMIQAPPAAKTATPDQALVVRPLFYGPRVESISIANDRAWILHVMGKKGNSCENLKLEDKKEDKKETASAPRGIRTAVHGRVGLFRAAYQSDSVANP